MVLDGGVVVDLTLDDSNTATIKTVQPEDVSSDDDILTIVEWVKHSEDASWSVDGQNGLFFRDIFRYYVFIVNLKYFRDSACDNCLKTKIAYANVTIDGILILYSTLIISWADFCVVYTFTYLVNLVITKTQPSNYQTENSKLFICNYTVCVIFNCYLKLIWVVP